MRSVLLDLIRVAAVIFLLIFHIGVEISTSFIKPILVIFGLSIHLSDLIIAIFVCLSGLVLELKYGQIKYSYNQFIINRFLRIYPTYFFALIIGVIIYFLVPKNILSLAYYYNPTVDASSIFCSLAGFCNLFGYLGGPFIGTGYFIGIIFTLYLIYPFLSKYFKINPLVSLFILLLMSLIPQLIFINDAYLSFRFTTSLPLYWLFAFGLGMYLAVVIKRNFWQSLNRFTRGGHIIGFIALLSFPIFLIHFPFLFIINYLNGVGINLAIAILLFLLITIFFSLLAYYFDKNIREKLKIN